MVKAQDWLDKNYPLEKRSEIKSLNFWAKELEGSLNLEGFTNLEELNCSANRLTSLGLADLANLKELICHDNELTNLNLHNLTNLKKLSCYDNNLTELDLTYNTQLAELSCSGNFLTDLGFLSSLNPEKLVILELMDNNFTEQDLSCFRKFINLKSLSIANSFNAWFSRNVYNRFTGSLEPLKSLNKLESLSIMNTDIDSGLEYLSDSIKSFFCWDEKSIFPSDTYLNEKFPSKVRKIEQELNKYGEPNCRDSGKLLKKWKKIYYKKTVARKQKEEKPSVGIELDIQEWINEKYPTKEERIKVKELYLNEKDLAGELDLTDFTELYVIYISYYLDKEKLSFKNQSVKVKKLVIAQNWLDEYYPEVGVCKEKNGQLADWEEDWEVNQNFGKTREDITELNISDYELEGFLELKDFANLKRLNCSDNQLTDLEIINCPNLEEIYCCSNQITELDTSLCPNLKIIFCNDNQFTKLNIESCSSLKKLSCSNNFLTNLNLDQNEDLEYLNISNNDFQEQDLSFLRYLNSLENLIVGNKQREEKIKQGIYNRFYGSLEPLKNLRKLETLDISNGVEFLPNGIESFFCATDERKDAKCRVICDRFIDEQEGTEIDEEGNIDCFPQTLKIIKARHLLQDEFRTQIYHQNLLEQKTQDLEKQLVFTTQQKINQQKQTKELARQTNLIQQISLKKQSRQTLLSQLNPQNSPNLIFWLNELISTVKKANQENNLQNAILENVQNKLLELGVSEEKINELRELQQEISRLKKQLQLEVEQSQQTPQIIHNPQNN